MPGKKVTIDGNEAAAYVAYLNSEVIAIYPITPSSPMGELADAWAARGMPNLWGTVPSVTEMQSEAGAAAAVHGALQTGALSTTFTASQGLLLMLPNMYKIAGELTPTVFHVSARSIATHALSIFGDHSDVMMARPTGFAQIGSGSVQEVMDLALVAHAATLEGRLPFIHFFDGFRTSHEVAKIEQISADDMRKLIDPKLIAAHRARAMTPERPVLRGSAQNPDVFFQAREACNPFYSSAAAIVQRKMDELAAITGRRYRLFDYVGAPDAEFVLVMMGSGAEVAHETATYLAGLGRKVGLVKVRLYRPFDAEAFVNALPRSVKRVATLDRTKEPGATGEPLYQDVVTALTEHFGAGRNGLRGMPRIIGGRYGLSSKDFTPAMVNAVFDELDKPDPKNHFTVGIDDDVTHTSLPFDPGFSTEDPAAVRAMFFGLGSDGTVGANKNSVKIIGEETDNFAQGYFVYDSKKAGSITVSHLRFGRKPIRSSYLIDKASFVACHNDVFLERFDILRWAQPGATFLLNVQASPEEVWDRLPRQVQKHILDKKIRCYVIDAFKVAGETGMGRRINTIMQTCFFAISGVLPREEAIAKIKDSIKKTYASKGDDVVRQNFAAVDTTLANLFEVPIPRSVTSQFDRPPAVSDAAPEFVRRTLGPMIAGDGDSLPVSQMPCDGTFPTDTARWEKRNIALEIPVWDAGLCIQCNKCALVCPHAAIRANVYEESCLSTAPETFKSEVARGEFKGLRYTIQVAPEDCTGCGLCVEACPAKNKSDASRKAINMAPQPPLRERERVNYEFFLDLPVYDRTRLKANTVKGSQIMLPLFEYSGACAGCGETPYVKLVSQLFGDRAVIANATGCSSIYGGNLPTTPWAKNRDGRGPTWSNSLFEDAAEFGLGFRLAIDKQRRFAVELLIRLRDRLGGEFVDAIIHADQTNEIGIHAQRERIAELNRRLDALETPESFNLRAVADTLLRRSVWSFGGDGWAYDIGFGGLDHVLASGRNLNVLVLDTEVYSNTGGQMSKATPRGAVAKFAEAGREADKKDLGMHAMAYGNVYVTQVAMGANDNHTVKAFVEAESYNGPSLIIAYSHCIAHGINMTLGLDQQKAAVDSGHWLLYRYDPRRAEQGLNPLQLDSKRPSLPLRSYVEKENRYRALITARPERAEQLLARAQEHVRRRYAMYARLAAVQPAAAQPAVAQSAGGGSEERD
ncbi:MAG: pyruvate:ferredoxin (flavodoxin) oxidoreductase [Phycisphaerales bacterium]|nr:MAG: pyruvate:ferredoxin (flavodoxin) oxidoreductase [Phycisphaerales bacterium]